MELIVEPAVVHRPVQPTLGIRVVTPFRGMLAVRDRLWEEVYDWLDARKEPRNGSPFLRLNVVDMAGLMDLEAGIITSAPIKGDDRVKAGQFPAGAYASLTYRDHAIRAHKMLIEWVKGHEVELDVDAVPAGERFACRYELILTDPQVEPRKTKWVVQINILTRSA
jgi:effector-binding domain-containing protein